MEFYNKILCKGSIGGPGSGFSSAKLYIAPLLADEICNHFNVNRAALEAKMATQGFEWSEQQKKFFSIHTCLSANS